MNLPKHILVPTDLTEASAMEARKARALANVSGAKITVLHVVDYVPPRHIVHGLPENPSSASALVKQAKSHLSKWVEEAGIEDSECVVEVGSPRRIIIDTAKERGVDLIIMSTQGERGIARIVGSTTHGVLRDARCDVLVVHPE